MYIMYNVLYFVLSCICIVCFLVKQIMIIISIWHIYHCQQCTWPWAVREGLCSNGLSSVKQFCPNLAKGSKWQSDISRKRAKCVCHLHWRQWNIMMSYLTYLLVGWVFLHEIWPGRRAHYVNYEHINNSNLDGMSLASFCQSRAEFCWESVTWCYRHA